MVRGTTGNGGCQKTRSTTTEDEGDQALCSQERERVVVKAGVDAHGCG